MDSAQAAPSRMPSYAVQGYGGMGVCGLAAGAGSREQADCQRRTGPRAGQRDGGSPQKLSPQALRLPQSRRAPVVVREDGVHSLGWTLAVGM